MSAISLLSQTKSALGRLDIRARKRLGQHFLVDEGVLKRIVAAAELAREDVVVEVGPGLGVLTAELAKAAGGVVAVELDDRLAALLKSRLAGLGNVTVLNQDIMKVSPHDILKERESAAGYKVVANLPYYITGAVLRHFLANPFKPRLMVVMLQREVADAIACEGGDMSILALSVQFYARPHIVEYVPAACFYPPPQVDSAVLRLEVRPRPAVEVSDEDGFFSLIRSGFAAPRKQLANSLAQGLVWAKDDALSLLAGVRIDPKRRAETLSLEDWARLWRAFVSGEGG